MPNALRAGALRAVRPALRAIGHDDELSLVGHLDELRGRLILSLVAVTLAFGFCFWQNHALLHLIDSPLAHQTQKQVHDFHGPLGATYKVQLGARDLAVQVRTLAGVLGANTKDPAARASLAHVEANLQRDVSSLSAPPQGDRPVTLGVGEPFTTTITVTFIFALILSLPILLAQAYGFLMPAFEPAARRKMKPLTFAIPVLFIAGVAFGYFVVLPAAVRFFQNFNSAEFNVLVQAAPYYKFAATTMLAMGLLFQVPIAILAVTRGGVITPRQLRHNRRYAVAACAAVAAVLPGDAITMLLETVPLYLLFEGSVLLASIFERRAQRREAREARLAASPGSPSEPGLGEGL
ncbi:MAG: twin-arginine translocase subunit TatC [Solirubrobacteraceae bacterium]